MTRTTGFLTLALFAAGLVLAQTERSAEVQLKAAMHKEQVEGDLKAAIKLYQSIVEEHAENRAVAARALLQMGQCYEKLGQADAREAYGQILRDYSDQPDIAAQARVRLLALEGSQAARHLTAVTLRKVWAGDAENGTIDPDASVSPDGHFLSYVDFSTMKWGNLAIHDLGTGKDRLITTDADGDDAFAGLSVVSPDCRQVAYSWHAKDRPVEMRVASLDGTGPRILTRFPSETEYLFFRWSDDGKQIPAVIHKKDGRSEIALISVADGSIRVLLELPQWRSPGRGNVSISPDGRYVVYDALAREGARDHDIFLLSVDGPKELPLVEHPADDYGPVWTPDGKMVLFASDRMGSVGFWASPIADGKPAGPPSLVKRDVGPLSSAIGFTRDGSYYYAVSSAMEDVYLAEMDPGTGRIPRPSVRLPERYVGSSMQPLWSPDGRYLAYASRRGKEFVGPGALTIVIRSADTGEERDLSTKLIQIGPVSWFPDGRSLLVPAFEDQKQEKVAFYRLDVHTEEVSLIRGGFPGYAYSYVLSPDGSSIFYCQNEDSKTSSILAYRIESAKVDDVYRVTFPEKIGQLGISPDGRQLSFGVGDVGSSVALKAMSTSGGEPRELLTIQEPENLVYSFMNMGHAWVPDGKYLLAVRSTKGRITELLRVPATGGEAQRTGLVMERISHPSVHPDGRRIAFDSGIRGNHEIWVMENFLPALKSPR
jgi:Tol biopolymer transport system component